MIGTTLHHYHILSKLGAGGMGEVYIAEDTKLHREVALKVLPRDMAADPERLQRFQREARAVAALNHPNVVTIYAVEEAEGVQFIAMELVEGKTLGNLIPQHGMDLQEFLRLAVPLADAIAAAHQRGIVHRDLKPANIMVTAEGRLKVLDFGLAKLKPARAGSPDGTTIVSDQLTLQHSVIGTPSYMSPEQAEAKPIDHRTDIFSAGVVLYEMVTGTRPFKGESVVTILSSIIKDAPAPAVEVNPRLPQELDRIIMHCLAKDPDRRYQSALDLRNDLEEVRRQAGEGVGLLRFAGRMLASSVRRKVRWVAALAAISLIASAAYLYLVRSPRLEPPKPEKIDQLTSWPGVEQYPSLKPDGEWVVYSGWDSGHWHIYLQSVDGQNKILISKELNADDDEPAYSPDGKQIAFRSSRDGGGIFVMGGTGEAVHRLTDNGFNPAWSPDGTKIVYSTENVQLNPMNGEGTGGLWMVDIATEKSQRISAENAVQPNWSPNNYRIAYASTKLFAPGQAKEPPQMQIYTIPVEGGEPVQVTNAAAIHWCPVWSRDGKYLYFASDRRGSMNLWRVPMDEKSGKPAGEPEAIITPAIKLAHPTLSADGKRIAYSSVVSTQTIQSIPFDPVARKRTGEPVPITTGSRRYSDPDISPDGNRIVFYSLDDGEIYIAPADGTGTPMQVTSGAQDRVPRWSPLGDWIAFFSDRGGGLHLWKIRPDRSGLQQITDASATIVAWKPDGSRIAVTGTEDGFNWDKIYIFDPDRPWREQSPQQIPAKFALPYLIATSWSPDGEKLACQIGFNEGGSDHDLGIVTYTLKTGNFDRLTQFGEWPVWLPDSRRILFVSNASDLFLVDSQTKGEPESIFHLDRDRIGPPRMTKDGRLIVFSRGNTEADIFVVELR